MIDLHNKSVMVIDDDVGMQRALEKVLTGEGCRVTCVPSIGNAMENLVERKMPFDLVITDLWMPCVSGLAGLYGIRNLFPDLPVVVLTAFGNPDLRDACLLEGANAFLEKPLNTVQLLNAIEAVFVAEHRGCEQHDL